MNTQPFIINIGQNKKIILKLKTKAMNKKETNTTTISITRGQSISRDLLIHVLKFSTSVTGAGRILGRHEGIFFQCFKVTSVVSWTTSAWIGLTSQTLWQETKKLQTLRLVTEVTL